MPNSEIIVTHAELEQRWLAVIIRLQQLMLTAFAEGQTKPALALWQALRARLILPAAGEQVKEALPNNALIQLLQWDFLSVLTQHLEQQTLLELQTWCSTAVQLTESADQQATLHMTYGKLMQVHSSAPAQALNLSAIGDIDFLLNQYQAYSRSLGAFVRSYKLANKTNQTELAQQAAQQINDTEQAMRLMLNNAAWDTYTGFFQKIKNEAQRDNKPLVVSSLSQLITLEWLATLQEQQQVLQHMPQASRLFYYNAQLAMLRSNLQTAVAALAASQHFTPEDSDIWQKAQRTFSQGIRALLAEIFADGEAVLGTPPCAYAFIGFGSLSRDEMLSYSDLECGLLIPPNLTTEQTCLAQAYFYTLWQWFCFSLQGLGESGEYGDLLGLHIDHQLCPKELTSGGLGGIFGTVEQIIYDNFISQQNLATAEAYSLLKPVYIAGNSANSEWTGQQFMRHYHQTLTQRLQVLAAASPLASDQAEVVPSQIMAIAQLTEHRLLWQDLLEEEAIYQPIARIKVQYVTPILCLVFDLALYHNVAIHNQPTIRDSENGVVSTEQITNTCDTIAMLVNANYLSPVFGRGLQQAYLLATYLRWQIQQHYQQQLDHDVVALPEASEEATAAIINQDPLLIRKLAHTFTKPTPQNLYRLSPTVYAKLQQTYRFILEPVVVLMNAQPEAMKIKHAAATLTVWYDPLINHLTDLLGSRLSQSGNAAITEVELAAWLKSLVAYLLVLQADNTIHEHIYTTLSQINAPEVLRTAYIDIFQQDFMQQGLIKQLSEIPNRMGYRQSERLAYVNLQRSLRAISLPGGSNHSAFSAESSNILRASLQCLTLGRRPLNYEVVRALIDPKSGNIKPFTTNTNSRHRVGRIENRGCTLHIKQSPDHPGMERAIDLLYRRLIGYGTTANELAVLTVSGAFGTRRYPVLLSVTVPGPTLKNTLAQPQSAWPAWDLDSLAALCLVSLLINPGDMTSRNLIVQKLASGLHTLVSVDNDVVFVEPVIKESLLSPYTLQVANILLCFPEVAKHSLSRSLMKAWCQLDVDKLLQQWLTDIEQYEQAYEKLFTEQEIQQLYQNEPASAFTPSTLFRQGVVAQLALNLNYLQGIFNANLQKQKSIITWEIVQKLQPKIAKFYLPQLANKQLTPELRMQQTAKTILTSRTSAQAITAMLNKVPSLAEIKAKNRYSATVAKKELQVLQLEQLGDTVIIHSANTNDQARSIQADFTPLTLADGRPDLERQELILKALMGRCYQQLTLINCAALTDNNLMALLSTSSDLHTLRLRQCPQITASTLDYLANQHLQLAVLECSGIAIDKVASAYINRALVFPNLTSLSINKAKTLTFVRLTAPKLTSLTIQFCSAVQEITLNTPQLQKIHLQLGSALKKLDLPMMQLAELILQDTTEITEMNFKTEQLTRLHLSNCLYLAEDYVINLVKQCPILTDLVINNCPQLNYRHIVHYLKDMQWNKENLPAVLINGALELYGLPLAFEQVLEKLEFLIEQNCLNLQGLPITDGILKEKLQAYPEVAKVDLRGCGQISIEGCYLLTQSMPSLQHIIDSNYNTAPAEISKVTNSARTLSGKPALITTIGQNRFACALDNGAIALAKVAWEKEEIQILAEIPGHAQEIEVLANSPSGILATGCQMGVIKFWDFETASCIQTLEVKNAISSLSWLNNEVLISSSKDKIIRFWDIAHGVCIKDYDANDLAGKEIIPCNQTTLAYGVQGGVKLYNFLTDETFTLSTGEIINIAGYFPNKIIVQGEQILASFPNNIIYVWSMADRIASKESQTPDYFLKIPTSHTMSLWSMAKHTEILSLGRERYFIINEGNARLFDATKNITRTLQNIKAISVFANGGLLVIANDSKELKIFKYPEQQLNRELIKTLYDSFTNLLSNNLILLDQTNNPASSFSTVSP